MGKIFIVNTLEQLQALYDNDIEYLEDSQENIEKDVEYDKVFESYQNIITKRK